MFRRTGSMVLGFNDEDRAHLEKLRQNGLANGVPELSIIGTERIRELEPRASAEATCALWCPSTGFVDPFEVAIAALENAVANGVTFIRSAPVEAIEVAGGEATDGAARFTLVTPVGDVRCRYLINAAGNDAADISHMAGAEEFQMVWRQGNIVVLDKEPRAHAALPRAHASVQGRNRHGHGPRQHRDHRDGCRAGAGRHADLCKRCERAAERRAQAGAPIWIRAE